MYRLTYKHILAAIHTYIHAIHTCTWYLHAYMHAVIQTQTCVHTYVQSCIDAGRHQLRKAYTHIDACTHAYTHTYIHTHI